MSEEEKCHSNNSDVGGTKPIEKDVNTDKPTYLHANMI